MGFMDNLRKLTQPYGEEDDFFEGADSSFAPQESEPVGDAQMEFESSFAEEPASAPEPVAKRSAKPPRSGGLFSRSSEPRSSSRPAKTGRGRAVSSDQSVVRFNPRSFDEAGELVSFLEQGTVKGGAYKPQTLIATGKAAYKAGKSSDVVSLGPVSAAVFLLK